MESITGTIKNIANESRVNRVFMIGRFIPDKSQKEIKIIAFDESLKKGDYFTLHGDWENKPPYGMQFTVRNFTVPEGLPPSRNGFIYYLEKFKIKGIGKKRIEKLYDNYGDGVLGAIENDIQGVAKHISVKLESLMELRNELAKDLRYSKVRCWLFEVGLSQIQAGKVVDKYGEAAKDKITGNPYILYMVDGIGFPTADKIAMEHIGFGEDSPDRIKAGVLYSMEKITTGGSCSIIYSDLYDYFKGRNVFKVNHDRWQKLFEKSVEELINSNHLIKVRYGDDSYISLEEMYSKEVFNYNKLRNMIVDDFPFRDLFESDEMKAAILEAIDGLNEDQTNAVYNSLDNRLHIITGGAGTGKTYIESRIRQLFQKAGLNVYMSAPTGKAARRIEQMCGDGTKASTIHRMLGYGGSNNGGEFKSGPLNTLPYDVIFVDEISMVDTRLMYHLLSASDDNTVFIFIGDHNQLPSVGPGRILHDIVNANKKLFEDNPYRPIVSYLNKVVRQAGVLKMNCLKILDGVIAPSSEPDENGNIAWKVDRSFGDCDDLRNYLADKFRSDFFYDKGLDIFTNVQVLTPQNNTDIGTVEINKILQKVIQRKHFDFDVPLVKKEGMFNIYKGDKVIQTRNNYSLGVFNGTLGIVRKILDHGSLEIDFESVVDGEWDTKIVNADDRKDLKLAYALTIHKSQGSEFDYVICIAHSKHRVMGDRHLLYTGATRAKINVEIIGDNGMDDFVACEEKSVIYGQKVERVTLFKFMMGQIKQGG